MKVIIFLVVISVFAQAETSVITCAGQGLQLKLSVQNTKTQTEVVSATLTNESLEESKQIEMSVLTQILKPGEYYRDKEVRIYQGFSVKNELNLGFSLSQLLDESQKTVRYDLNKFGRGQVELGQCQVE
jgi:hypothetical protein